MSSLVSQQTQLNPQAFVLTPKVLEKLGDLRLRAPNLFEQALRLLTNAQDTLFVPFLTKTAPELVAFEFERLAYQFFSYRLTAFSLLLRAFGPSEFEARYVAAFSKMSKAMINKAPEWGLESKDLERVFSQYLSTAVRMLGIATVQVTPPDLEKITNILRAITRVDFGLTALVLAFEESIFAEKWLLSETFAITSKSLNAYQEAVSSFFQDKGSPPPIAGSLTFEGDIDQALERFNRAWQTELRKNS